MANVTKDDLKRIADEMASGALTKLTDAFGLSETNLLMMRRTLGYDCKGQGFQCGEYNCTGAVSCAGAFGCNIKFTG